jgi:hypothetical protein
MGVIRFVVAVLAAVVAVVLTIPVVLVGLPFWVVSALTRSIRGLVRWIQPGEVAWTELIDFVPEIGWKNRGNVRVRVRESRSFKVSTDADGWRGSGSIDDCDLVVFGDSFAFGHGVDDRDCFQERFRGLRVKAVGVNGYNMVQQLLWIERLRDRLAGKPVMWLAFYGNDLMDNLHPNFRHYRTPFVRSSPEGEDWEIVTDHVRQDPWPFDPDPKWWGYDHKIAEVCTPSYQSDRAYSACAFLVERAASACAAVGSPLGVVGVPDVDMLDPRRHDRLRARSSKPEAFDPGLPDRRMKEMCDALGVPFLDLSDALEVDDHLPNDCHWTPRGHRRVARVLEAFYEAVLAAARTPGSEGDDEVATTPDSESRKPFVEAS